VAVLAVAGTLALFMALAPGGVLAQDAQLGPPRDLTVMSDGQTMMLLSWRTPASGTAVDYRIDRAKDADGSVWESVDTSAGITILGDIGRFTDSDLKAGTTYHYRVFAINDNNDEGEPTDPVSAATGLATRPAAPKTLTLGADADDTTAGQLTLEWTPPDVDGGATITSYRIESSATGTDGWSTLKEINLPDLDLLPDGVSDDESITGYKYVDKSLKASTTRYYRVFAVNKVETSDPSSKLMGTTSSGNTPAGITSPQVQGTDGQIILRWIAPDPAVSGSELTGAPVTGYKIEQRKTSSGTDDPWVTILANTNSTATTYRAGNAIHTVAERNEQGDVTTPAGRWRYQITPINSVGAGITAIVTNTGGVTAPDASDYGPVGPPTARAVSRTEISISWAVPANGGEESTTYRVFASKDGGKTWTVASQDGSALVVAVGETTATHTGLKAGERWSYLVFATTSPNIHRESRMVSVSTAPAVPPEAPTVTATATSAMQINLVITAPSDNGGNSVTGYMIERSKNQVAWETIAENFVGDEVLSSDTIEYYDKKLPAGTTFYYRVRAINSVGAGEPVLTSAVSTPASAALGAPDGLVAVAKPGPKVDLYWLTPGDPDGAPITGYWIELSEDNGANWSSAMSDTASRATVYTHQGPPAGKALIYRVQAINSVGPGPASAVEEVMTSATMLPSVPTMVTATTDSDRQITVSWMAPADMGAGAITGYMVQRGTMGTDGTMSWTAVDPAHSGTDMEYMDTGLMAETTYYYRVAAMNSSGMGDYSDGMAMAMTMAEGMPTDGEMLTSPSGVDAASLPGTGAVSVSWTPGQNATQHWVVLFSLPGYDVGGRVEVLNDPDANFQVFRNVPVGEYEVVVASYDPDTGFQYQDGIGMVTVE
jgi:titin